MDGQLLWEKFQEGWKNESNKSEGFEEHQQLVIYVVNDTVSSKWKDCNGTVNVSRLSFWPK